MGSGLCSKIREKMPSYLHSTNDSWRVDETYIKVKDKYPYLDYAVDSAGNTIDFVLSVKRDKRVAKRFLCKALKATCS